MAKQENTSALMPADVEPSFSDLGSPENAALAELALFESRDDLAEVSGVKESLRCSVMYQKACEEKDILLLSARMFVAGQIAERAYRRRERARRKQAEWIKAVRCGREQPLDVYVELLP